jgi:hypothetical protein
MDEIEGRLGAEFKFQLAVHTNMTQWEAMDRLGNDDWENIIATVRDAFAPFIRRYAYTAVGPILQNCQITLSHVVWAAVNVPFPRNPFDHIERVVENTLNVVRLTMRDKLRAEILMANHYAHLIQRNWRRVITDPTYAMCRKRLMYEFKKISSELEVE